MDESEIAFKLPELLRHPEDLDKLVAFQADFQRKKTHVDSQLKAQLKAQIEATEAGMNAISNGQRTITQIKEEMQKIDKLCQEAQDLVEEFPIISKVSKIHKNFLAVEEMKRNLNELDAKLNLVDDMLRDDYGEDISNPMPNLLPIHYYITQLRDFEFEALHNQGEALDPDVRSSLQQYFEPLADRIALFDERLGIIGMNMLELIKAGNTGLVVRAAKIIDQEERSDSLIEARKAAQNSQRDLQLNFKSIQMAAREPRGYKQRFFDCIKSMIQARFEGIKQEFWDDPGTLDDNLLWYFEDLTVAKEQLPELMPAKWNIFDMIVGFYTAEMRNFLNEITTEPPKDPNDENPVTIYGEHILVVILWVSHYNKQMKALKIPNTSDYIIDDSKLIKDYLQLIVSKMEEWMITMVNQDTQAFTQRAKPVEADDTGRWGMQNAVIMFQMINQQIEVACDSNKGSVVAGTVEEIARLLKNRQETWDNLCKDEVTLYQNAPEQAADGLLDYLIAVANDQIKCANYAEATSAKTVALLSKKFGGLVQASFDNAIDGFVLTATNVVHKMVDVIFVDLKPAFQELFTPAWYGGGQVGAITETINSYIQDPCETALDPDLLTGLIEELSAQTVVSYLSAVKNKGCKFNGHEAINQIRTDVQIAFSFFTEYLPHEVVKNQWFALESLMKIVSAQGKEPLKKELERFKESYWDASTAWIEAVVKAREDYNKSLLEAVRETAAYTRGENETIMARVTAK
ncbi:exocyst complex component Sec6 [Ascobolus immersus RN42]|uniref:Exocyst complex component Sec6 n=1 Tax=Ascobolus immersus RN42 TaxID=1160509 RepID=A0A3N4HU14_ASCIM|nr:exocyst complex component Sec6 [Ascobolus immersus RN42]